MKTLRVGVVGVGHIGKNHARLYAELSGAQFTAILDTDPATAHRLAEEFGVVAAASLEEFAEQVDAASIATPTNTHFDIAHALLTRGKHLLIEKPIAENTAHATELAELAAARGLVGGDNPPSAAPPLPLQKLPKRSEHDMCGITALRPGRVSD